MGGLIVVDASAGVEAIVRTPHATQVIELMEQHGPAIAPAHFDAESWSGVVRLFRRGHMDAPGTRQAAAALARFPITRMELSPMLEVAHRWIGRVSAPDAFYAILAEGARAPLLTCDLRLARALDGRVPILYVEPTVH